MKKPFVKVGKENTISKELAKEISYEDLISYGRKFKDTVFKFGEMTDFPFPGVFPLLYPKWQDENGEDYLVIVAEYNFLPQAALYLSVDIDYLLEEMEKIAEQAELDAGYKIFELHYATDNEFDYLITTVAVIAPEDASNLYECLEIVTNTYLYPLFVSSLRFAALRHQEDLNVMIKDLDEIIQHINEENVKV
ncbi:hypothetical protein AC622_18605 [Bacillus sp. FJAT-27916]|uniref:hypothetical protein n=1 Tax=Bacillaceae TaxID=186817 RepID=UPI0006713A43|nr:hypothetical protein [Bacillus sp. FJAT-27916]KMY45965.1 hypothetical protein AC622_18605 [Bacillus sp. FJAT-27916]